VLVLAASLLAIRYSLERERETMPITTFTELQQAIEDYLVRSNTELNGRTADFIALFEGHLNRTLRVADMMATAGPAFTQNIGLSAGAGALPGDCLEWLQLSWSDGTRSCDLRYVEPNSEEWRFRYRPFGDPSLFTIVNATFYLRPYRPGVLTFFYYKAIPALATNATNWLLQRSPDVYLNGSLAEAYRYLKDDARANDLMALVNADLAVLTGERDTNKVARRPPRQAELEGQAAARNPATGAA
jgi:hypothetical protein